MSTSSFKKVSAAAIAAVIGFSGIAHAAPITLPYGTNFGALPYQDSNGDSYTDGALQGQGNDNSSGGWVNESGEQNDVATVAGSATGNGTVTLNAVAHATVGGSPVWSDVYNANLADHPAGLYGPSNGNGVALNATSYGGNITVSYNLNVAGGGSTTMNGTSDSSFGTRILDSSDNLLAALFVGPSAIPGEVNVYTQSGTGGNLPVATLSGPPDGQTATYAIHLDLNNDDFQVFVNGVASGYLPLDPSEDGVTSIGGIALSTDNLGTNSAVFSNFSVVPEPASFAMAGIGGLMLLAKRRRRQA